MKHEKDVHIDSQQTATRLLNSKEAVALWGAGKNCRRYMDLIRLFYNVQVVVDMNIQLQGTYIKNLPCISSEELLSKNIKSVIVMIEAEGAKESIIKFCLENQVEVCEYRDVLDEIYPVYEKNILQDVHFINADPEAKNQMKKYIGINVPAYGCNFNCSYCYLDDKITGKNAFPKLIHYPEYIRYQLRREKIGGAALIGVCAYGETLLTDKIVEVCTELLKEGHYLHIVTNGIVTQRITDIIEAAGEYAKHIIFKISFHYMELKQKKLLDKFVHNVSIIEKSDASFTLELMPHDEIVEMIPEILKFSMEKFGAYPQLTIGRDEHNNRKLLTSYSIEKYKEIWSVFNSEMFDARMSFYMMHGKNCNAGRDGFFVDLYSGDINRCVFTEGIANFYEADCNYDFEMVKDKCPLDYCYNCHVYATLGLLPDVNAPTYMTIRDRVREDGSHWIKEDMRRFLDIKLYDINKEVN